MPSDTTYDYSMERRLRDLSPELHKRFTDAVFGLQHVLSNYKLIFPEYTDHTELHSLNVIGKQEHLQHQLRICQESNKEKELSLYQAQRADGKEPGLRC